MAEPTISNTKILYYGTQANYDAIQNKDDSILYFCTDSKKIFKGEVEMTEHIIVASTKPTTGIITGKLYVIAATGTVEFYDGSAWHVVSYPIVKSTDAGGAGISAQSTDVEVPSAAAVYEYVQGIIGGDDVVTDVTASTEDDATIVVTKGDGSTEDVVVPGVVLSPTWDSSTRTLTFPISDDSQNPVVVEIGKDIFIDKDADNRYEDGYLYLYLNDGTQSTDPTEIAIPVTALITDYFGDSTDTVQVTIDNSTHKVTADVRVRPDSSVTGSEFTNLIKISSVTGSEGIYFDRAELDANTEAIDILNATAGVTGSVAQQVKVVDDKVTILNGDASVTGSVDQKVKVVQDQVDILSGTAGVTGSVAQQVKVVQDQVDVLNATAGVTGSVAQQVKVVDDKAEINAANIAVLANAQGWGTF